MPNQPLEWTGHQLLSAVTPQASCLPLMGSVRRIGDIEGSEFPISYVLGFALMLDLLTEPWHPLPNTFPGQDHASRSGLRIG